MDRSYPDSRRLVSRARLGKRMVAVLAASLAGAAAVFMLAWKTDVAPAAPVPAAGSPPGFAGNLLEAAPRGPRRIYPYSVVPGGVSGPAELARVIRTDRVVATHYASFDVDKARPVVVDKARAVHVSYRKGDKVYWTARKVMLAKGETLLSDGRNEMRARCANRISDVPQYPVEAHQPTMDELDVAVDVEEGEEYALGADGLPVSVDPATGMPHQAGQRFAVRGGGGGIAAIPASAPADTLLAGSSGYAPVTTLSPFTSMGLSSSSGSTSGQPRPDSGTPASSTGSTATDGSGGSSSGSPAPSDGSKLPTPVPDTGSPAGTPLPGTPPTLPPTETPPPSTTPAPAPAPTPSPMPKPIPGAEPVFAPAPGPQPNSQQSGGGGGTGGLPTAPGNAPLLPQPGPGTDPFIPKPDLTPPLQTTIRPPGTPADVPEPGSIWLAGTGLALLCALRRRRPRQADGG